MLKKIRKTFSLRVGNPLDKNTDIGAINSKEQLEKITELVASGVFVALVVLGWGLIALSEFSQAIK